MASGYYQLFREILEKKDTIKLMNVFQGVPITYEAAIVEIRGAEIRVLTHPLQLICIRHQKETFISYQSLIYKAMALSTDMQRETVLLTNFELTREVGFRKCIRVEPLKPVKVCLCTDKPGSNPNGLLTSMVDISINGMAVCMNSFLFNISALECGDKVGLKFNLFDPGTEAFNNIQARAILRNITSTSDKTIRLGFEFLSNAANEGVITHFVAQRQKNALKELKKIYEEEFSLHF